jgi:hypothetical protein
MTDRDRDLGDPDAPPTAEELRAAEELRGALEGQAGGGEDIELARALRAAWAPEELEEGDHAAMLDEVPSGAELELAESLRAALEGTDKPSVVSALQAAWRPRALAESEHRAIVDRALAPSHDHGKVVPFRRRASVLRLVSVSVTGAVAIAASVLVWVTGASERGAAVAPLARARSTQSLFDEPFKEGETSARIDKIALARSTDFRDNRFTRWGVR